MPPLRPGALSYSGFLHDYLTPNFPVVLPETLTSRWIARREWVKGDGKPDWDRVRALYGSQIVSLTDCQTGSLESRELADVISRWLKGEARTKYVKDWHLARSGVEAFYETPDLFRDDWLNDYAMGRTEDDFRFVYAGCGGTFTPVHKDVYGSYSWSSNVAGWKRWWLFPPEVTHLLRRFPAKRTSELVHDVRDYDSSCFPHVHLALERVILVEQAPGETIFVPSGWHHQVLNVTGCISINHNWANAACIPSMYQGLCEATEDTEAAVDDVKDLLQHSGDADWRSEWTATVQRILKADAGWDFVEFWEMVHFMLTQIERPPDVRFASGPPPLSVTRPPLQDIAAALKPCARHFLSRDDLLAHAEAAQQRASAVLAHCERLLAGRAL